MQLYRVRGNGTFILIFEHVFSTRLGQISDKHFGHLLKYTLSIYERLQNVN